MQSQALTDESRQDLLRFVESIALFDSLAPAIIEAITSKCEVVTAHPEEVVFLEGDPADSFYMIREGHVKVVREDEGSELIMAVLDAGEGFGEMALLVGQPRSATVKAIDECVLVRLLASDFKRLTLEHHDLLVQMNRLMSQRVSLLDDTSAGVDQRAKFLRASPRFEMDPTLLDLLMRLNEATGVKGQIEHCKETAVLAREMSKILCPMVSDDVFYAGYLHEIGKIGLDTATIEKQRKGEPLTPQEQESFDKIYRNALRILKPDKALYEAVRFIEFLGREHYEQMPLETQIVQAAHEYLEFVNPYYRGLPREKALEMLRAGSGSRYNPRVVAALEKVVEKFGSLKVEKQIKFIRQMNIALDVKDNYTLRHSYHVRVMALKIGQKIALSRRQMDLLHMACDMHDVGKIYVPVEILNAPRKLTPEEFDIMKKHPLYSAEFFEDLPGMEELKDIIMHHHERFDGRGYPHGLKGEQIHLLSRVEVVADVWSALTTPRVYRIGADGRQKAYDAEEALEIMNKMQPGHFDPDLFEVFTRLVRDRDLAGSDWRDLESVDVDSPWY